MSSLQSEQLIQKNKDFDDNETILHKFMGEAQQNENRDFSREIKNHENVATSQIYGEEQIKLDHGSFVDLSDNFDAQPPEDRGNIQEGNIPMSSKFEEFLNKSNIGKEEDSCSLSSISSLNENLEKYKSEKKNNKLVSNDLKEAKKRLVLEQEMVAHLRKQVQNEIKEKEKLEFEVDRWKVKYEECLQNNDKPEEEIQSASSESVGKKEEESIDMTGVNIVESESKDRSEEENSENVYQHLSESEQDLIRNRTLPRDVTDDKQQIIALQKEVTSLNTDCIDYQQKYAECLQTLKEVQDAYADMKNNTLVEYKQEVLLLQDQLAKNNQNENNEQVIKSFHQDSLDSHLLLEKLKQMHRQDVERLQQEHCQVVEKMTSKDHESSQQIKQLEDKAQISKTEIEELNNKTVQLEEILISTDEISQQSIKNALELESEVATLKTVVEELKFSMSEKDELLMDIRNQLEKEAEFLTRERESKVVLEKVHGELKEQHQNLNENYESLKQDLKLKILKVKFIKKQFKELQEEKQKGDAILFLLPEMQKRLDEMDIENRKLENNLYELDRKEKEKTTRTEFEKYKEEERVHKERKDWEHSVLGIGKSANESVESSLDDTFNRTYSDMRSVPGKRYAWSNNIHRKQTRAHFLNPKRSVSEAHLSYNKLNTAKERVVFPSKKINPFKDRLNTTYPQIKKSSMNKSEKVSPRVLVWGNSKETPGKQLLALGDRILTKDHCSCEEDCNEEHLGTVMFIGFIDGNSADVYIGMRLDQELGNSDGKVQGKRYFRCEPERGRFVHLDDVQKLPNSPYTRPIPLPMT